MYTSALLLVSLVAAATGAGSESLFSRLVQASAKADQPALTRALSSQTLSISSGSVVRGDRVDGGELRHGVSPVEIAGKLEGCIVKQWRDINDESGGPYILWQCPMKRVPENECYFYSYRAEMLDPRYHPANLFIGAIPSPDGSCRPRRVAPPGAH